MGKKAFKPYPKEDLTGVGNDTRLKISNKSNTKSVINDLEEMSEMGFTKKSTSKNRRKDDAFGKIGL